MAQDSIIGSLFGITPEAYQQSQQQQELAQAMAYGKLDPYESARAGFFQAGRGLGRAIGGLIGAEDPQLRMITQQQEILRNIDQTDPKSIAEGVKRASEMGNPRLANALSDLYRKTLESGALTAQRLAAATKEKKLTVPTSIQEAQYIASQKQILERLKALPEETEGKSEAIASIEAQLKVLEKPEKPEAKTDIQKLLDAQKKLDITIPAQKREYDILQKRIDKLASGKTTGQEIGEAVASGFGVLAPVLKAAFKTEGEETGKFTAKNYNDLQSSVSAGIESKRNLDLLSSSLENAFTGSFADSKTSVIKALDGLGIPVDKSLLSAASNTELIEAMSTKYIFPLVKNFPGALAVKELDTLKKAAPGSQQQRETIAKLINVLSTSISENEYVYNKAKEYRGSKRSLIGFDAPDVRIEFQRKLDRLTKLRDTAVARGNKFTQSEKNEFDSLKAETGVK